MDNSQDNHIENEEQKTDLPVYQDPNAGYESGESKQDADPVGADYQDNYSYNVETGSAYNNNFPSEMDTTPLTMGDWLLTILVMTLLPCVGIPLYFVWAFGKNGNLNRRNYCRAYLIVMGISIIIGIIIVAVIGVSTFSAARYYY